MVAVLESLIFAHDERVLGGYLWSKLREPGFRLVINQGERQGTAYDHQTKTFIVTLKREGFGTWRPERFWHLDRRL